MTSPQPQPRIGVVEFLQHHLPYGWKIILVLVIVAVLIVGCIYLVDLRRQLEADKVERATLAQQFQQLGANAVTRNQLTTPKLQSDAAQQAFGDQVAQYMRANNAKIQSLTNALGSVEGRVSNVEGLSAAALAQHQNATTGQLSGFPLEEVRRDQSGASLPPLSQVAVSYDPAQRDPNVAFRGTFWTHYREDFRVAVGDWKASKDGGLKTSVSLKRTIFKPDPAQPGQFLTLGVEDIPIGDATTTYTPADFAAPALKVPRWTAMIGIAHSASGNRPSALLDYRLTNRFGLFAGAISSSANPTRPQDTAIVGGISIRFGAPK